MKHLAVVGVFLIISLAFAPAAFANDIFASNARVLCSGYCLDLGAEQMPPGTSANLSWQFTLKTASGSTLTVTGSKDFTVPANGIYTITVCNPWTGSSLTENYTVTGFVGLTTELPGGGTEFHQTPIIFTNGSGSTELDCGTTTNGKTFSIKNSMEGDLAHIMPGDWISGGYSFKFVDSKHAATNYTVTSSITLPVYCPDGGGPGGNILIPLGTQTIPIAAGDTNWKRTGDQNSILSWEGSVQAPNLCGGNRMRNQIGATFTSTVSQDPQVGLVDWRFHYRDPAAKGKPNTNCTDADDPNRNRADVCGASWSQTFRDP